MALDAAVEALARRDRLVVSAALALVMVVSWAFVLAGAGTGMTAWEMTRTGDGALDAGVPMAAAGMAASAAWTPAHAGLMFLMWWVMMVAMMLPGASPMILLFATVNRRQRERENPHVHTFVFALGYLLVWAAFSAIATALQWTLLQADWLSGRMAVTYAPLGGALLVAAGAYQFTRLKRACLIHCQSPLQFFATHWRAGARGALRMGIEHGAFCVGCCWFLMLLLFAGGIMNLYWIGGLALYVLVEKFTPPGHWLSAATGALLSLAGVLVLVLVLL